MTTQESPWNDPRVVPKGERFVKFKTPGDNVEGMVTAINMATFDEGADNERTVPVLVLDDGREITCSATNLHAEVYKLRPEVGDAIRIRYTGDDADNYNRKVFDVRLKRDGDSDSEWQPQDPDLPPDPAAAPAPPDDVWAARSAS